MKAGLDRARGVRKNLAHASELSRHDSTQHPLLALVTAFISTSTCTCLSKVAVRILAHIATGLARPLGEPQVFFLSVLGAQVDPVERSSRTPSLQARLVRVWSYCNQHNRHATAPFFACFGTGPGTCCTPKLFARLVLSRSHMCCEEDFSQSVQFTLMIFNHFHLLLSRRRVLLGYGCGHTGGRSPRQNCEAPGLSPRRCCGHWSPRCSLCTHPLGPMMSRPLTRQPSKRQWKRHTSDYRGTKRGRSSLAPRPTMAPHLLLGQAAHSPEPHAGALAATTSVSHPWSGLARARSLSPPSLSDLESFVEDDLEDDLGDDLLSYHRPAGAAALEVRAGEEEATAPFSGWPEPGRTTLEVDDEEAAAPSTGAGTAAAGEAARVWSRTPRACAKMLVRAGLRCSCCFRLIDSSAAFGQNSAPACHLPPWVLFGVSRLCNPAHRIPHNGRLAHAPSREGRDADSYAGGVLSQASQPALPAA